MNDKTNITAGDILAKVENVAGILATLNPTAALVYNGAEALKELFSANSELSNVLKAAYAETAETAPEIAQEVSDFCRQNNQAIEDSFRDHPGS
jgi:uncharacterized protein YoxC